MRVGTEVVFKQNIAKRPDNHLKNLSKKNNTGQRGYCELFQKSQGIANSNTDADANFKQYCRTIKRISTRNGIIFQIFNIKGRCRCDYNPNLLRARLLREIQFSA
jgi:hypothetical protein